VREQLRRFRGREVKTPGDGFLASFDGPARSIRCAEAVVDSTKTLGVDVRIGLHTGECEVLGDDLGDWPSTLPPGWVGWQAGRVPRLGAQPRTW
jgi:class 3 adenylate cyclase